MPAYTTSQIRNIAIVGAAGSGKTTLVEALLHAGGAVQRAGRVEDGSTQTGADPVSKHFGTTIDSCIVHLDHGGVRLNIIDTPGAPDFVGAAIGVLPAVETVVVVIDAVIGVQTTTRRMVAVAKECNLPTMIIVNKMDMAEDEELVLAGIQEEFGEICQPIDLPVDHGKSVIDCFDNAAGSSDLGAVKPFHDRVLDRVAEEDDALLEEVLGGQPVSGTRMHDPFEKSMRARHIIPICFVSARSEAGVKELLNDIIALCPSPCEGNPRPFEYSKDGATEVIVPSMKPGDPLLAHVFKMSTDPFAGRLAFFKVHQGTLGHGANFKFDDGTKAVRVPHVYSVMAAKHKETDAIVAGDIGAVSKIEELHAGTVIHADAVPSGVVMHALPLPKPMYGVALEAANRAAETKLGEALHKLAAEDATLAIDHVTSTKEVVLRGLGELHLRVKLYMLKERFGVEVTTHPPKVAYREAITAKAEGHYRHKKQTGGAGQFGEVFLRVEPLDGAMAGTAADLEFVDDTFGGSVPKQYLPAIEKGVRQVLHEGAIAGYPLGGIKVEVYDGKYHPVDRKEVAFTIAGKHAFIEAIKKARPVLLEPFVHLEITSPPGSIGAIVADLSSRRGRVQGSDSTSSGLAVIRATAPMSELMTYASTLKSITAGLGSYTMEFAHAEPAPPMIQAERVAAYKPALHEA